MRSFSLPTRILLSVVILTALFAWYLGTTVSQDRKNYALIEAVKQQNIAAVQSCLNRGADPNAREIRIGEFVWRQYVSDVTNDRSRHPAIQVALNYRDHTRDPQFSMIKLLLKRGADVNARDSDGVTLLHFCCERQEIELARYLLDQGADVNAVDHFGGTPLMWSAGQNRESLITLLLDRGARVNDTDSSGDTALMRAVQNSAPGAMRILLRRGAEVNRADGNRVKPLMTAVNLQNPEAVHLLLEKGADVNAQDREGQTALMFAVDIGSAELAETLLKQGAEVNRTDHHGQTALYRMEQSYRDVGVRAKLTDLLKRHGGKSEAGDGYMRPNYQFNRY